MIISFRQRVVIKRGPGFGFLKKLILTSMHYCPFEAVSVLDQYASIAYLSWKCLLSVGQNFFWGQVVRLSCSWSTCFCMWMHTRETYQLDTFSSKSRAARQALTLNILSRGWWWRLGRINKRSGIKREHTGGRTMGWFKYIERLFFLY